MKQKWERIGDYEFCWGTNQRRRVIPDKFGRIYNGGKIMEPKLDRKGYIRAPATFDGHHVDFFHEWVALFYHGPKPKGKQVNHKDGNKLNNDPRNLEYLTQEEHRKKTKEMGLYHYGTRTGGAVLTDKLVKEIRKLYATSKWTMKKLAEKYVVAEMTIWAVIHRRNWKHVK